MGAQIRSAKRASLLVLCCAAMLLTITTLTFYPLATSSSDASALTGTATPATTSLVLTTGHTTADVEVTPFEFSGAFAASSSADEASFSVTTNNNTGYTLSIKASDDMGKLTNTSDSSLYLDSIESNISESSFDTATYNNKWGYKPSKYKSGDTIVTNNSSDPIFLPSPTTSSTILDETSTANTTANTYTIGLGIRADYNTIAGTYSKSFTLLATANPSVYTINYDENTTDTVSGMPTSAENIFTDSTTIILSSSTPTRDGHNFGGWCSVQTADDSCSGTTYQPGATYGIDQTAANVVTLYAMWESDSPATAIQDITISTCPTTPTKVYDTRDNEVYTIQKLNDGRCWLLDNLRLGGTEEIVLTPSDTNIVQNYTLPASSTNNFNYDGVDMRRVGIYADNETDTYSYGAGSSKAGVYYNYCAASAGTLCYRSSDSSRLAKYDICPKNWRIPTGDMGGEYQILYEAYSNDITNFRNALRVTLVGDIYQDQVRWQNDRSYIWSSTISSYSSAKVLSVTSSNVNTTGGDTRYYGNPMRCILNETNITEVGSLQRLAELRGSQKDTILSSMVEGQPYQLKDSRDGEIYNIAKLADNRIWFLDNLRLNLVDVSVATLKGRTNASDEAIEYLKGWKTGTTSDAYATNGVALWESSYSYSDPLIRVEGNSAEYSYGSGSGSVGVRYNYCAASAGSYCYGNGTSAGTSSGDATEDICPKGWRMPIGGANGEYKTLYTAYSSNVADFKNAFHAVPSGYFYNGSDGGQGTGGYYLASTRRSASGMYRLLANSSVTPASYGNRNYGFSVRCVLDQTVFSDSFTTMQSMGDLGPTVRNNVAYSMVEGQHYTVSDSRDSKEYTITKTKDGLVWMTTNLDIAGGTKLVPTTSNIAVGTTYTLPASKKSGFSSDSGAYVFNSGSTDCTAPDGCYSYYSFKAATAGTNPSSGEATSDICPKGWRLPKVDEQDGLYYKYPADKDGFFEQWQIVFAGTYSSGSTYTPGAAVYWSSSASGTAQADRTYFGDNGSMQSSNWQKRVGYSVRCVLK